MSHFDSILTDVFDRGAEARLTQEEEVATIARAQMGEESATVALIYAYAPALRSAASRHVLSLGVAEARSAAVAGLLEAIAAFRPESGQRLAGILRPYVDDTFAEEEGQSHGFAVPVRTLKRFFGILRRAGGDVNEAVALAPSLSMTRETFLAVLAAVREVDGLDTGDGDGEGSVPTVDRARPLWDRDEDDADDRILVEVAFGAVDDLEADVVRLAYGFADYEPVPDAEIAHRLLLSRQKVQRTRSGALAKMRDALAIA